MFSWLRGWLPSREQASAWLDRHPWVTQSLDRMGCLHIQRRTLARGVAVGVFVGLTPTVGLQTVLMLLACILIQGNFPMAFLASWISNPITMGPLYFGFNQLGKAVFGGIVGPEIMISGHAGEVGVSLLYLCLGSLLIAAPLAVAAYFVFLGGWRLFVLRRRRYAWYTRGRHCLGLLRRRRR